jgi:hypothetical protein
LPLKPKNYWKLALKALWVNHLIILEFTVF